MEGSEATQPAARAKPTRALPTRRIAFETQLDILRAYGAMGADGRGVTNEDLAGIVDLHAKTTSLVNTFFTDVGFIGKAERGNAPAAEVIEFQRAYQWDPDAAARQLAPILSQSWFWEVLQPKLAFNALKEAAAIAALGQAAAAEKYYAPELRLVLEYLEAGGLVSRDNGMVTSMPSPSAEQSTQDKQPDQPQTPVASPPTAAPSRGSLPLLVQGLLEQLPRDGHWTKKKSEKWLDLARLTFEIVYEFKPDAPEASASFSPDQDTDGDR